MESIWSERLARYRRSVVVAAGLGVATALALAGTGVGQAQDKSDDNSSPTEGQFQFEPLPSSTACTPGGNPEQPFVLPTGYTQNVFAREGDGNTIDLWDMNTQNETGIRTTDEQATGTQDQMEGQAGRFLYRTHETRSGSQVSFTDLETNETRVLAQRPDWERFDGIVWNKKGTTEVSPTEDTEMQPTILAAEEVSRAALLDPAFPQAQAGLVYEIDPVTGDNVARPAIGARSHEGMRFDPQGNLYGISETNRNFDQDTERFGGGFIYRFVPDRPGDLSSGQLYALQVEEPTGDRTGEARWVPLPRGAVEVNSDAAAAAAGATGYDRPEDVEITTSTGNNRQQGANALYVSITGEDRVLKIDLREPQSGSEHLTTFVSDYVRNPGNAPEDFTDPDNLALDRSGNLFITEDPPGNPGIGADIWAATPPAGTPNEPIGDSSSDDGGQQREPAEQVVRFASLTDCAAEPTGIYFKMTGRGTGTGNDNATGDAAAGVNENSETLFVNVQHRGGDGRDLAVAITQAVENTNSGSNRP